MLNKSQFNDNNTLSHDTFFEYKFYDLEWDQKEMELDNKIKDIEDRILEIEDTMIKKGIFDFNRQRSYIDTIITIT